MNATALLQRYVSITNDCTVYAWRAFSAKVECIVEDDQRSCVVIYSNNF